VAVEVRNLFGDTAPKGVAWILIEKKAEGFAISGKAHRTSIAASFASHGLDPPEAAIRASVAWADLLDIPLIYIKD
jgi:hypothetical protein